MDKGLDKSDGMWYNPMCSSEYATVAQLVEQLIRNQQVAGSNPASSSIPGLSDPGFFAFPRAARTGGVPFHYSTSARRMQEEIFRRWKSSPDREEKSAEVFAISAFC